METDNAPTLRDCALIPDNARPPSPSTTRAWPTFSPNAPPCAKPVSSGPMTPSNTDKRLDMRGERGGERVAMGESTVTVGSPLRLRVSVSASASTEALILTS